MKNLKNLIKIILGFSTLYSVNVFAWGAMAHKSIGLIAMSMLTPQAQWATHNILNNETTLAELKERIAKTIAFISTIPDAAFDGAEARTITVKAGPRELSFPAPQYLASYAIPNFYFHMSTAYSILRANGVEVGKTDFLGG